MSVLSPSRPGAAPDGAAALQRHLARGRELSPGLHLHADDTTDAHDFTATGEMGPGLRIVVLLEGSVDVSYGAHPVALSCADRGAGGGPRALLVSVAEPERFERRSRRGAFARRVSMGLGREWLERVAGAGPLPPDSLGSFCGRHLAMHHWRPSTRITALAEQITRVPPMNPVLQHLYLESRALELIGEALGSLAQQTPAPAPRTPPVRLLPHEHRRVRALHDHLLRDDAGDVSLDALARQAGINASTLQRHFRAVYGTTVFDFLRETRLLRARHALEHDGFTVAQAALLAGYTSPANFATAFRRRFGLSPKLARGRV